MRSTKDYLNDLLKQLVLVEDFTAEGKEFFYNDPKTQNAVMRCYEVIGEIVKRLPQELLATQPHIDWQDIKGFRDFLIHNYNWVELHYVWKAVEDLPRLRKATQTMLDGLNDAPPSQG